MNLDIQASKLVSEVNAIISLDKLSERDRALLRQTFWHALERAYLAGYDAAATVVADAVRDMPS